MLISLNGLHPPPHASAQIGINKLYLFVFSFEHVRFYNKPVVVSVSIQNKLFDNRSRAVRFYEFVLHFDNDNNWAIYHIWS